MRLKVRFSPPAPDLELNIENPSAALIRSEIRKLRPDTASCRLRLIVAGRIIVGVTPIKAPTSSDSSPVFVHCVVGPSLSARSADESSLDSSREESLEAEREAELSAHSTVPLRGFDRLVAAGISPVEVQSIRSQFMRVHGFAQTLSGAFGQTHTEGDSDFETHDSSLRDLEEQWMDDMVTNADDGRDRHLNALAESAAADNASSQRQVPNGAGSLFTFANTDTPSDFPSSQEFSVSEYASLILGCIVGFYGNFMVIPFMIDNTLVSDTIRLSLFFGIAMNFILGFITAVTI
ncbi:hypothetical protein CANCADRAFT_1563 [Tortispora caseinolytica NRRL Y-17796]|uniref:DSC E3 ubiquitin ligase complex subunit 3 C-terminal domain-containing protein n=1 Tax=Tortispora caseinolytica NRRL Y-17796 TaxID=767744 RepID=A0A1E4TMI6_9ASCO|nr:hypothetical protein CANCADRAFT_1563 [Tortispora caseinolytica NRRL Y-17796]